MLVFVEGRKPDNPDRNPLSKARTNNKPCRVLYIFFYAEALSRGPTPYPFVYHFDRKGTLSHTFSRKKVPLSYVF